MFQVFYSAWGPVFSSTVVPPDSRLSKWTVNQAVNPWNTPDLATQKWNWPFISWEMKRSSWLVSETQRSWDGPISNKQTHTVPPGLRLAGCTCPGIWPHRGQRGSRRGRWGGRIWAWWRTPAVLRACRKWLLSNRKLLPNILYSSRGKRTKNYNNYNTA